MKLYTAQYRYTGPYRLDITVKGQDPLGKVFAPTWDMVKAHKRTNNDQEYITQYHTMMLASIQNNWKAWKTVLSYPYVVIVCFCPSGKFCHRHLLVHYLKHYGAEYIGELDTTVHYTKCPNCDAPYAGNCSCQEPKQNKKYAGIGSRQTPPDILKLMYKLAQHYAKDYTCCTGAALGADQAFANGANSVNGKIELSLPWNLYGKEWINTINNVICRSVQLSDQKAYDSVTTFHPAPEKLSPAVKKLHARNYLIIENCDFVICWTPNGKGNGGTGQGIRIAKSLDIPVYDLGNKEIKDQFIKHLENK